MENYQKSIKHCPDQDEIVLVRKIFQNIITSLYTLKH